jgi:ERF superfamily
MSQSKKDVSKEKEPVKKQSEATNLIGKLVEILAELGPMPKKGRNPHFGYDYIKEGQVMAELRHKLADRRVFLFTSVETCAPHYGQAKEGTFVSVTTKHTFVDADSQEQFAVGGAGLGWDSGDKGVYKAITGAMKYALMKNFLLSDEQDPEAGEKPPAGAAGHRRTKPYEDETGEGDTKVASDLLVLKSFLTEHKIPEGFLLRLLQDKKLIDGHTKFVANLKPGVVTRCISDKSKANLLKAWKAYEADQDSGGENAPDLAAPVPKSKEKEPPVNEGNGNVVRTNEGDQTVNKPRKPVQTDLSPKEVLEQDGYDNWRQVPIHFGDQKATPLGKLTKKSLAYWLTWVPKPYKGSWNDKDLLLDAALTLANAELSE